AATTHRRDVSYQRPGVRTPIPAVIVTACLAAIFIVTPAPIAIGWCHLRQEWRLLLLGQHGWWGRERRTPRRDERRLLFGFDCRHHRRHRVTSATAAQRALDGPRIGH